MNYPPSCIAVNAPDVLNREEDAWLRPMMVRHLPVPRGPIMGRRMAAAAHRIMVESGLARTRVFNISGLVEPEFG